MTTSDATASRLQTEIAACERNVARLQEMLTTCSVSWEYERVGAELDEAYDELAHLRAHQWLEG